MIIPLLKAHTIKNGVNLLKIQAAICLRGSHVDYLIPEAKSCICTT
jgi:hypothetical protein